MRIGAEHLGGGRCAFTVWAPLRDKIELKLLSPERIVPMVRGPRGYWKATVDGVPPGSLYLYRLDEEMERPDPASHFQPQGVFGPSQVVDHGAFPWEDGDWRAPELSEMIHYEIHVGAFTPEGTFEAVIPRLEELSDLGVNSLLLMPVAQFPGERNWGYDGAFPYAVQNSYGGPEGLKRLVNACHRHGLAVKLDVVYNHMGPEGCAFCEFGPVFTPRYQTPWGDAMNMDGAYSDGVRNFFIENTLFWFRNYHMDILRMDAVDRIVDIKAYHFLQELADRVHTAAGRAGKRHLLIAEADENDPRLIRPKELGGYGLDAQWLDDFHHCLHTLSTGEREGYYADFGKVRQLAKSFREGYVYTGGYSEYRKRRRGQPCRDRPGSQFVVFSQNHDQVGNRRAGERFSQLADFEKLKLAAGTVLLSPFVPLLFMGEEYGEERPFLYFVDHMDPALREAVKKGRSTEFASFAWEQEPPDPTRPETFRRSKLQWEKRLRGRHRILLDFYHALIRLRRETPALANCDRENLKAEAREEEKVMLLRRWEGGRSEVFALFNFHSIEAALVVHDFLPPGKWRKVLCSADSRWMGPGSLGPEGLELSAALRQRAHSFAVYRREGGDG